MVEKLCKNCKYWEEKNSLYPKYRQRKGYDGINLCKKIMPDDAYVSYDFGLYGYDETSEDGGGLITGPNFGCIYFEEKT